MEFLTRLAEFLLECLRNWGWLFPLLFSGFFLCQITAAFLPVRSGRRWKALLFVFLSGVTGMVIWVGDENLLLTLPVFFAVFLACSRGDRVGRLAVTAVFFCLIMPVCALLDTYYVKETYGRPLDDFFLYSSKLLRPVIWGLLYLAVRRRLPDRPPRLSPRLWKLVVLLASMPFCSLVAVVAMTAWQYDVSPDLHGLELKLGLAVLPFVFLTSLALLYAIRVLEDHERLEEADKLASLRESYYQGLRREERQVRTLRHDLRNHLTVVQGLLERGETERAARYLGEIAASPAMGGRRILCENETANVVLAAKAEAMDQAGLTGDFAVSLPRELPITDTDLCALLGNALDNAMEAAAQAEDKEITVRCRVEKGLFMLRVENAVGGEIRPDLATTKADRSAHGFGLSGMREIAERCGGSLETRAEGGRFQLVACLPLDGGRADAGRHG